MILLHTQKQFTDYQSLVESWCAQNGQIYFHSPHSIEATFRQFQKNDFVVMLDVEHAIASAFVRILADTWQCTFNGFPLLTEKKLPENIMVEFLLRAKLQLDARTLYFPLVYQTAAMFKVVAQHVAFTVHDRLPSPIITGSFNPGVIWQRVQSRYGSRADRQKKRFEQYLFTKSFTATDVEDLLTQVELGSWKRTYKQDMLSRDNQIAYYASLVKSGLARITFAFAENNRPVAYRIDAEMHCVLFILKWSFLENFKRYSPGFYLLTVDLFKSGNNTAYTYIDLYGSPDALKSLIETDRLARVDIYLSDDSAEVARISRERQAHDTKIDNNYRNRQSIKKMYLPV